MALLSAITIGAVIAPAAASAEKGQPETEAEQPVLDIGIGSPDDIVDELLTSTSTP